MTSPRRIAAVMLAGALLAACGDQPPVRQVVTALPLALAGREPVLALYPAGAEGELARGAERVFAFAVDPPPARYTVRLRHEGERPHVLDATGDDPVALRPLAGRLGEDLLELALEPRGGHARLIVRAAQAPTRLLELVVARRPDGARASAPAGDAAGTQPVPLTIVSDQRPGILLAPGERRVLPLALPAHATRLASAVAADPRVAATAEPRAPRRLRVLVEQDGAPPATLVERDVQGPSARWDALDADLSRWAGHAVRLVLENAGAPGADPDAPPEPLAVALPQVLCERGARRSNLVLVVLDTTRRDRLGTYGHSRPTSPRIDALGERAVVFEDALACAPYTLPSHATIFSGRYPSGHGTTHPAHALDLLRTPLLAARLLEAGYRTRAFTGGGYVNAEYGFGHGFLAYANLDPLRDLEVEGAAALAATARGGHLLEAHAAQSWDAALAFVEDSRDVPFFLFLQTFAIHDYRPPRAWRERFVRGPVLEELDALRSLPEQLETPFTPQEIAYLSDVYDASIAWVDEQLGRLLDALDAHGLREHTIVVVTADHGEAFGERGGLVGHGRSLHAEMLDVPLIVAGPGLAPRRLAERVSHVDLAPTLLDLLGVPVPDAMQGRSLRPLLEGDVPAGWPGPSPALAEVDSNVTRARALHDGPLKLVTGEVGAPVLVPARAPVLLFDLRADPGETASLHERDPGAVETLRARLDALLEWSARGRGDGVEAELGEETRAQLEALGYLGG